MKLLIIIILIAIGFILFAGYQKKCPNCGRLFSMKEIERKLDHTYSTTIDIEQEIKNNKGEKTGTYKQAVPATAYVHNCIDECKYCGFKKEVKRTNTYRD